MKEELKGLIWKAVKKYVYIAALVLVLVLVMGMAIVGGISAGDEDSSSGTGEVGSYDTEGQYWWWPIDKNFSGEYISSGYGNRSASISGWSFHGGIDIAGGGIHGKQVIATKAGTVIRAVWGTRGYGRYVQIDHGNGYQSLYGHMSNILVKEGDIVAQGQAIGEVGSTGNSTGPHLHFEIRKNDQKKNPADYVKKDSYPEPITPEGDGTDITRLVNTSHPLPESYKNDPEGLVDINYKNIKTTKSMKMNPTAYEGLKALSDAYYNDKNKKITICSAYRSYSTQQSMYDNASEVNKKFYQQGLTSEHRTGLAIDFGSSATNWNKWISNNKDLYIWLYNNSYKYGFILRYPKDTRDTTKIEPESWHFRYIGVSTAKKYYEIANSDDYKKYDKTNDVYYSIYTYEDYCGK